MSEIPDDIVKAAQEAFDQCGLTSLLNKYTYAIVIRAIAEAILAERQRGDRDPNPALLLAAKTVIKQWDTPNWKLTQYTAPLIEELRKAVAEAESLPDALQGVSKPLHDAMTATADHLFADGVGGQ